MKTMKTTELIYSVSDLQIVLNQTFQTNFSEIIVEGEVANFKINQNKWVFFDLKDNDSTLGCFMSVFQLKTPIENGMVLKTYCTPKLTKWGKFSLTVRPYQLTGAGSVKRAYELLKAKLEKEGLFLQERKRQLPYLPSKIALITSSQAAAYNDFISIVNKRWSGIEIDHLQVQVQGEDAPDQICKAIEYVNQSSQIYDCLVIIRGGGSAEDLQAFQTEQVVRAVFSSKAVSLLAIGHEDDVSLAELSADFRASTPSDAARVIVPDKVDFLNRINGLLDSNKYHVLNHVNRQFILVDNNISNLQKFYVKISQRYHISKDTLIRNITAKLSFYNNLYHNSVSKLLVLDPAVVLKKGYAVVKSQNKLIKDYHQVKIGQLLMIQLYQGKIEASVKKVFKNE